MKRETVWQIATALTFILFFLSTSWIGVFFLTAWLYQTLRYAPPPFLIQYINSLLGLLIFASLSVAFFHWSASKPEARRKRREVIEPIIEALERIAKGDFQVRLNPEVVNNMFTNELAKSVNQMAAELDQMEHMRQEFISNVSHEIQSPLTSIRGFAYALHDEHLSAEERQHYLSVIEMENMRISRMTDNMLKLASLESERMKLELQPYRLDKQIRTLILACEPQWTSKMLELEVTLAEVVIDADEDLLSQVWSNLLHNSIKFTPQAGRVSVDLQQHAHCIECKIIDTGIGIPEQEQTRIFERFYKVDTARERARDGSGLGLAIARKIVKLHHGTINVISQPGNGTSMIVSLPVE
jgi:two-component system, OmpR family, phosphate regulon sensor histidine kinase PhoR